jgi:hypothetical protein
MREAAAHLPEQWLNIERRKACPRINAEISTIPQSTR